MKAPARSSVGNAAVDWKADLWRMAAQLRGQQEEAAKLDAAIAENLKGHGF